MLRLIGVFLLAAISAASAQATRNELKRADLTGTNMEIIVSVVEVAPGNGLPRHTHAGEEAVYFLEGATVQLPDGSDRSLESGTAVINVRDVPHAGFKVAGDKPLKMLTVHIVDKGKPMSAPAN
jgi:quercetin dioxygenase-like cupin family protein